MIILTGAAGFIGSYVAGHLHAAGFHDLVLVDDFLSYPAKAPNHVSQACTARVERDALFDWLAGKEHLVQFVLHLGARTDTTEQNREIFDRLNLHYTQDVWRWCVARAVPLIYASSAATYGGGEHGFSDNHALVPALRPLNPYGDSKQQFDVWALAQAEQPFFWAGLKFFNVYGPNEYHKGRMASVIFHAFNQIRSTGGMRLFRSHNADYADGGQMRDFVYVRDLAEVILWLMRHRKHSGLYNLGSGVARTFNDLALATFAAMGVAPNISYIDTPADIRDAYQYYTQADMHKLQSIGYPHPFTSLEDGVQDYAKGYLMTEKYYPGTP